MLGQVYDGLIRRTSLTASIEACDLQPYINSSCYKEDFSASSFVDCKK